MRRSNSAFLRGWTRSALAAVLALGGLASSACDMAPPAGNPGNGQIPPALGRFMMDGPFQVQRFQNSDFSFFAPMGGQGTFPVVTWGNGTATSPQSYNAFLSRLASNGFIVVATNSSNSNLGGGGGGRLLRDGLDLVGQLNGQPGSPISGRADMSLICSIGYSQGGAAAINAGKDPRVDCTVGLAPERIFTGGGVNCNGVSRILILGGGSDAVAPVPANAQTLFNECATPKGIGVLAGANHFESLGAAGRFAPYAIGFIVAQLRNDLQAASLFVGGNPGLAMDPRYSTTLQQ